jgi:hypothetical protein
MSNKQKLRPRRSAEKVLSFFALSRYVATQSLPQGMRKEGNTFWQSISCGISFYTIV